MLKKHLIECPFCKQQPPSGSPGFADQLDESGIAKCPTCERTLTREVLYSYWDREEKRYQENQRASQLRQLRALEKKWWQFWK